MKGLTQNRDMAFLEGKSISGVALETEGIFLEFIDGGGIGVYGEIQYAPAGSGPVFRGYVRMDTQPEFCAQLAGEVICQVDALDRQALRLHFSNGDRLTLFDSNREYPSYVIADDEHLIEV